MLKVAAAFGALSVAGGAGQMRGRGPSAAAQENGWETRAETIAPEPPESDAFQAASVGDTRTFEAAYPFYALGAHWDGSVGAWPVIEVSLSADGVNYSEVFPMVASLEDAGQPERDDRYYTALLFADGASFVQYRTVDIDGVPGEVADLQFTYIDATNGPWQGDLSTFQTATTDPATPPAIVSRAEWGADDRYRFDTFGEIWIPEYQTVEHVIIHHTDTPNGQDPVVAMRSIYYYHAVTRGWGDIGYNYLVDRFGNIYEGRFGGQNVIGGHAYQYAVGSSGIGTIGNYAFTDVSAAGQSGIVAITAWAGRALDPLGAADFHEAPNLPTICAHRDVNDSTCPGNALYSDLPTIRQRVAQVLAPPDTGPPGGLVVGDTVKVDANSLTLRSAPRLSGGVVANLPYGTIGTVMDGPVGADGSNWYQLKTTLGTGWVAANFLVLSPPDPPPSGDFGFGDNVVVTSAANLRAAPRLNATVVAEMPRGTLGAILDGPRSGEGYDWYQVRTNSYGDGWCVSAFLRLADTGTVPTNPKFVVGDLVQVNSSSVALRPRPGTAQAQIALMAQGSRLQITVEPVAANGFIWYGVFSDTYGGGWTVETYLTKIGTAPPPSGGAIAVGDTVRVNTDALNLRSGPGTGNGIIAVLPSGLQGTVVGGPQSGSGYTWFQLQTNRGTGWAASDFLAKVSGGPGPTPTPPPPPTPTPPPSGGGIVVGDTVAVNTDALNLRSGAGTGNTVIAVLSSGTQGAVIGGPQAATGYTWFQIRTNRGTDRATGEFIQKVSSCRSPSPPHK
jgi:uncharacterized protein YraI